MDTAVGSSSKPLTPRTSLGQKLRNLLVLPYFHTSIPHPVK
jgi:hypothetical protein